MTRTRMFAAALVALVIAPAIRAQESPLARVPAQAALVVHLRGVERTQDRLAALIKNAFPPEMVKEIQEKLQKKWAEILNGRQLRGMAADSHIFLVFLQMPAGDSPPAVFVRVTNYQDFQIGLLKDNERKTLHEEPKGPEGLQVALLGGKPIYFQEIDQYAVLTGDKETAMQIRKRQPGLDQMLGREAAGKFLDADLSIYLHTPALVKQYADVFKDIREKMIEAFQQFNAFHKGDKVAEQMVRGTIDLGFQALKDGKALLAFVNFQPDGLAFEGSLQIGPQTQTGKFLKSFQPSPFGELASLPAEHMAYSGLLVEPALLKIFPSALYGLSSDPDSPNYQIIQKAVADLAEAKPSFRLTAFRQLANFPTTWNDLEIWQYTDPGKAAAARLQIMKALRAGDVLEGILLKEQPKVQPRAKSYRGFTLHHARLTWDLEQLVRKQIGDGAPKEPVERMLDTMKKIMGEGKDVWFGSDNKVYVQASGADWAGARKKLDQYLDRSKTLAGQPAFQETRKHLPAKATVLHFIEMASYGQIMAEFMQSLVPKSEKIPAPDTSKTGYFGAAITVEPGRGKLDVWLPAAGIRAFFLPVQVLMKAAELTPDAPEPPKSDKKPKPGSKADQEAIQGTWKVVKAVSAGETVPNLDKANLVFSFNGNSCKTRAVDMAEVRSTFTLNPVRKPKFIDFRIPQEGTHRGIYELQGDRLKLCLPNRVREERPADFFSTKGNNSSIWFLERKSDKPKPGSKADQEAFQGTWNIVDAVSAGEKVPNVDKMNLIFIFEGNTWKTFELGKVTKAAAKGTFQLDSAKKPKAIDLYIIGAKGTQRGIYSLEGNKLKLCLPNRVQQERPVDFVSTKGSNCSIWFLERKK